MPNYEEKKIAEFRKGDCIGGFYFVKSSELKTSTTGNKYMDFTFSDKTGEINAKFWDHNEENAVRYKAGIVVHVKGAVQEFQGKLQLKVDLIRNTVSDDNINIADFIPAAPYSGESMLSYIEKTIAQIKDSELKLLCETMIGERKDELLTFPAAKKNHHAILSGLLYHTATMLRSGLALAKIYDFLNVDLLVTGIILHDLAKMDEMARDDSGLVNEYTTEGVLLGHLVLGVRNVEVVGEKLGLSREKLMLVEHMLLSHHYIPEHGSPKQPAFPEAELLHYLDIIDSRMYDMKAAFEATEPGSFSDKIWSLENRTVYHYNISDTEG